MKNIVLYIFKYFGIFWVCKRLIRGKLVVLAYHGNELFDECSFRPKLFIKKSTLETRLRYLTGNSFNVISLDDAINRLESGNLSPNSVVITVDDGWYSSLKLAFPLFDKYKCPATLYCTTYFIENEQPVLNVLLGYIIWKTNQSDVDIGTLLLGLSKTRFQLKTDEEKTQFESQVGQSLFKLPSSEQFHKIKILSRLLHVDIESVLKERQFSLINKEELKNCGELGVDIQLHTHRHRVPLKNCELFKKELDDNANFLRPYVVNQLRHFCYPSGVYELENANVFEKLGIKSATTCEPGLVDQHTNPFFMPRFLDGENIDQIVFEAELCGVCHFLRKIKSTINSLR